MDWNSFMSALKEAGVEEITLKFNNAQSPIQSEIRVPVEIKSDKETVKTEAVVASVAEEPKAEATKMQKCMATYRQNFHKEREQLRKSNPNYYSCVEIAKAVGLTPGHVYQMCMGAKCTYKVLHRVKFFDAEQLWFDRARHEEEILKNDGHRKGNMKFVLANLEKLIK